MRILAAWGKKEGDAKDVRHREVKEAVKEAINRHGQPSTLTQAANPSA
ncbi:MAG: hypothetical protein R3B95_16490 [Nitrospirales bacterium]|nr:hypothetical protein [Nitrospirales bacterium]